MVGVHYHCRTFLLTIFLCFCLVRHTYELQILQIYKGFKITCGKNESLHSSSPARDSNHTGNETYSFKEIPARNRLSVESRNIPTEIWFENCLPPNKPYLEILKDNNINASRVSKIYFSKMADADLLTDSLFEGMPLEHMLIYNNHDVYIKYYGKLDLANGSEYKAYCRDSLINLKPVFSKRLLNVTQVEFEYCIPPNLSYYDIIRKHNIRPSSVQELSLSLKRAYSTDLKPDNFKGLSLPKLSMSCFFKENCKLDANVFEELEANELYMDSIELTTLNKFTAKKVTMEFGEISGELGDCSILTSLKLTKVTVTTAGWLRHCGNLTDLTLSLLSYEEVVRTLSGASALNTLFVFGSYDGIGYKGPFAKDAVNLRRLTIKGYRDYINVDTFSALEKLEELDITNNALIGIDIFHAITPLQNLRKLSADRNRLQTFCDDYHDAIYVNKTNGNFISFKTVENVSLQKSKLTEICFHDWVNLNYLDLRHNNIRSLQLKELPAPQNHPLTVDLRGNPLETLTENFHYEDTMKQFKGSNNITILLDLTVECDCEHTSFVTMLRELPQISLENVTCTSGERLVDFAGEKFGCYKYSCHNCTCRTNENGTTVAYCDSKNLNAFRTAWNSSKERSLTKIVVSEISLIEIHMRNNTITTSQHNTSPVPVTLQQISLLLEAKLDEKLDSKIKAIQESLARELKQEIHDQFKQMKADINKSVDFVAEQHSDVKKDN